MTVYELSKLMQKINFWGGVFLLMCSPVFLYKGDLKNAAFCLFFGLLNLYAAANPMVSLDNNEKVEEEGKQ